MAQESQNVVPYIGDVEPTTGLKAGDVLATRAGTFKFDGTTWTPVAMALVGMDDVLGALKTMASEFRKLRFGLETYLKQTFADPGE